MTAADDITPGEAHDNSPWICHICDASSRGEGVICGVCFRITCAAHLRRRSAFNKESGLYEFAAICVDCIAEEMLA